MSDESWFEVITEASTLRQGDVIDEVPVVRADTLEWPIQNVDELPISIDIEDRAIVLSQSCDLENEREISISTNVDHGSPHSAAEPQAVQAKLWLTSTLSVKKIEHKKQNVIQHTFFEKLMNPSPDRYPKEPACSRKVSVGFELKFEDNNQIHAVMAWENLRW